MRQTASGSTHLGNLSAKYDAAGNLARMIVVRKGSCEGGTKCSQDFVYQWDEVGRLVDARRFDFDWQTAPRTLQSDGPTGDGDAHLKYAFDSGDQRVIKTSVVPVSGGGTTERHTVYALGSVELRRAQWNGNDYMRDDQSESVYLFAHGVRLGHLVHNAELPQLGSALHTVIEPGGPPRLDEHRDRPGDQRAGGSDDLHGERRDRERLSAGDSVGFAARGLQIHGQGRGR